MSIKTEYSRLLLKRTDNTGEVPTIPATASSTDFSSDWLDTDIYKGELFCNLADDLVYFRSNNGIFELQTGAAVTGSNTRNLQQIMDEGSESYVTTTTLIETTTDLRLNGGNTYINTGTSSTFGATVSNSVIIGGDNLIASEDNTVYVQNMYVADSIRLPTDVGKIDNPDTNYEIGYIETSGPAYNLRVGDLDISGSTGSGLYVTNNATLGHSVTFIMGFDNSYNYITGLQSGFNPVSTQSEMVNVMSATDLGSNIGSIKQYKDNIEQYITDGTDSVTVRHTKDNYSITTPNFNVSNLPTSSTGLSAGDIWNDSGTLKII